MADQPTPEKERFITQHRKTNGGRYGGDYLCGPGNRFGYMLIKIWPPVPWPDAEKHPQAIARALKECPTPTPSPAASPVVAAGATASPAAAATVSPARTTPTPAPNATATPTTDAADAEPEATTTPSPGPSPSPTPLEAMAMPISFPFFSKCVMTTFDERLLLLVMVAGMLGSFIHGATSLADYIGKHRFSRRWTLVLPAATVIGMSWLCLLLRDPWRISNYQCRRDRH